MRFIASAVRGGGLGGGWREQWSVTIKGDDSTLLSLLDEGMCNCCECADGGEIFCLEHLAKVWIINHHNVSLSRNQGKGKKNMLKASSEVKAAQA